MHCRGADKIAAPSSGGIQMTNFIPEGDLYRLIIRSKLPAAERFEKWVFDEVLPTVRKHGAYVTYDTLDELLRSPKFADALIKKLAREREKSAALEELATEMVPKALYCDIVLQCKNVIPVSLIAKDYGMSAAVFNRLLHYFGIQYKTGGTWLLYQKYAGRSYTQTRTYCIGEKTAATHTCWTQRGRLFLYEFLKDYGILPVLESGAAA
jgi:phage antirepressor YoqD-like protein